MDSATLASQLAAYNAKPVTATDALNTALNTFGVPEIRNTVSGLRTTVANTNSALNAVDPSVTGRTQGSLVTEAQRERQVNNERAPIAQNLTDENKSLTDQQQALTDALGQATTTANNQVSDYNAGRTALQGEYDMEYQREQDAASKAAAAAAAAEQQREFNVTSSQNATKIAQSGSSGSGSGSSQPTYQQKASGGGFNFQSASGAPISARLYAQQTGTNFNTLLKQMAAAGDSGAADVLKQGAKSAAYKALTWD